MNPKTGRWLKGDLDTLQLPSENVSDHRGSNSQVIDFERIGIYLIFVVKIENSGKSNT
jgi:hypothetical protein